LVSAPSRILLVIGLIASAFITAIRAADIEITATVNATKIGLDDTLAFTIVYRGIQSPSDPSLATVRDFNILASSKSSEFQFINGATSSIIRYHFSLTPKRLGMLTIPSQSFQYLGKEYRTSPFIIEVVKGSILPPAQPQANTPFDWNSPDPIFQPSQPQKIDIRLEVQLSKKRAYLGEQVIYTVFLYTSGQVDSVSLLSNQSLSGFWQEWFPVPQSITGKTQTINGVYYHIFEIRKASLFPNKTGRLTIPSFQFQIATTEASGFFFGGHPVVRSTPEALLDVIPLPRGMENLPVGRFSMQVEEPRRSIDINHLFPLKVTISGSGNVKSLPPPILPGSDDYAAFPAKIDYKNDFNKPILHGSMVAEIPITFKKTGTIFIPSLAFVYFDPDRGERMTLTARPREISVTGQKEGGDMARTFDQTGIVRKGEDIAYIRNGRLSDQIPLFDHASWQVILLILPFLFTVLVLTKQLVWDLWIVNTSLMRRKSLLSRICKQVQKIQDHAEIAAVLDQYIVQRSGIGYADLSAQAVRDFLKTKHVSSQDIDRFFIIKNSSEYSKFSPQKKTHRELRQDLDELVQLLTRIDKKLT